MPSSHGSRKSHGSHESHESHESQQGEQPQLVKEHTVDSDGPDGTVNEKPKDRKSVKLGEYASFYGDVKNHERGEAISDHGMIAGQVDDDIDEHWVQGFTDTNFADEFAEFQETTKDAETIPASAAEVIIEGRAAVGRAVVQASTDFYGSQRRKSRKPRTGDDTVVPLEFGTTSTVAGQDN